MRILKPAFIVSFVSLISMSVLSQNMDIPDSPIREKVKLERVTLFPAQFDGNLVWFEHIPLEEIKRDSGDTYYLGFHSSEGQYHIPNASDDLPFVISKAMASDILETQDKEGAGSYKLVGRVGVLITHYNDGGRKKYYAHVFEITLLNALGRKPLHLLTDSPQLSFIKAAEWGDLGVLKLFDFSNPEIAMMDYEGSRVIDLAIEAANKNTQKETAAYLSEVVTTFPPARKLTGQKPEGANTKPAQVTPTQRSRRKP